MSRLSLKKIDKGVTNQMFDKEVLEMYFDECELDFAQWDWHDTWMNHSDEEILNHFPPEIQQWIIEQGLNPSWWHGGM